MLKSKIHLRKSKAGPYEIIRKGKIIMMVVEKELAEKCLELTVEHFKND